MIASFELLEPDECTRVEGAIRDLRPRWTPRGGPNSSFFTLGAASYLDEPADYAARAAEHNGALRDAFGWLYERVAEFLSRRLRAPVAFADGLALPGFHIWLTEAIFVTPVASVHFDLQYLRAWPDGGAGADLARPLSFTLPIRIPARGAALNVWDITYERFRAFSERVSARVQPVDATVLVDRMRHPYSRGAIAMHSGHLLHQIGEIDEVVPGDQRITLQGHALLERGTWRLYW